MSDEDLAPYLAPTPTIESRHPVIRAFAEEQCAGAQDDIDCAIRLYYAIRDGIRYNPYTVVLTVDGLKATTTLQEKIGWCVPKAILLAACCRARGIPARLGYADVRNHLSTARMREAMKTDVFYWHGYTAIYLDGHWVKATPAFNIELCQKFRLRPLEFDGRNDSIYHPFDLDGNKHMEYLRFRGEMADVPIAAIARTFNDFYARMYDLAAEASFDQDVAAEVAD